MPGHDWTQVVAGNFHDFHQKWIISLCDLLSNGLLPEDYYALAEQRAKGPIPDLLTLEYGDPNESEEHSLRDTRSEPFIRSAPEGNQSGALLVEEVPPNVRFLGELEDADFYAWQADTVTVRHAKGDRVVAYVEIISPGNKSNHLAIKKYGQKLMEALMRGCQFLMIDILPPGRFDPDGLHAAVWPFGAGDCVVTADEPFGMASYRSKGDPYLFFERCGLGQPLPDMPLFITPETYVNLPLEQSYSRAWQSVPTRWRRVMAPEEFS